MKTVFFDVDGVIPYPTFPSEVYRPIAKKRDMAVGFWTAATLSWSDKVLRAARIQAWRRPWITRETQENILSASRYKNEKWLKRIYKRINFDLSEELLNQDLLEKGQKWLDLTEELVFTYKNPAFFREQSLLIESDSVIPYSGDKEVPTLYSEWINRYFAFAQRMGFSLLFIPEYPEVWTYPGVSIRPDEVMSELRQRINSWDGSQFYGNLGYEMGIYPAPLSERK